MFPKFLIHEIQISDLDDIHRIHKASFKNSALSHLGKEAVKRYYNWLLTGPHDGAYLCAVDQFGQIAGFCFAGVFHGALSGFINKNKRFLIGHLAFHPWLLFNPIVREQAKTALNIIRYALKKPKKSQNLATKPHRDANAIPQRPFGVLSIAVDPTFQRQGVGELLMREVENLAYIKGYTKLHLSVHPENLPAVRFYEKLGWEKSPSGGNWDGKMFKKLQ